MLILSACTEIKIINNKFCLILKHLNRIKCTILAKIFFMNFMLNMQVNFYPIKTYAIPTFGTKQPPKTLPGENLEYPNDKFENTTIVPDTEKINTPIKDFDEYKQILSRLKHCISYNGDYAFFKENDLKYYRGIDNEEMGILPYCGFEGCHEIINLYMTGQLNSKNIKKYHSILPVDLTTIPDAIRTLEYSLRNLDKKYGTYQGIVYRQGFMSENPNRYISTTLNPYIASCIYGSWGTELNNQYSVILVNNGHKIVDFQKSAGVPSANGEQEILLPYTNNYKKIPDNELTDELRKAKIQLASSLFKDAELLFNGKADSVNGFTKEDLLKMIDVYIQI